MTPKNCSHADAIDPSQFHAVLERVREMRRRFEGTGVLLPGHKDEFVVIRKPTMPEFQEAALSAGMAVLAKDWVEFYEVVFGEFIEQNESVQ